MMDVYLPMNLSAYPRRQGLHGNRSHMAVAAMAIRLWFGGPGFRFCAPAGTPPLNNPSGGRTKLFWTPGPWKSPWVPAGSSQTKKQMARADEFQEGIPPGVGVLHFKDGADEMFRFLQMCFSSLRRRRKRHGIESPGPMLEVSCQVDRWQPLGRSACIRAPEVQKPTHPSPPLWGSGLLLFIIWLH